MTDTKRTELDDKDSRLHRCDVTSGRPAQQQPRKLNGARGRNKGSRDKHNTENIQEKIQQILTTALAMSMRTSGVYVQHLAVYLRDTTR